MVFGITTTESIIFILVVVVFFVVGAVFLGRWLYFKRWPIIATLLEETVPNQSMVSGRDRARRVALTMTGEDIYYLKNSKVYRVGHGHYIGPKAMAWAKSKRDGYWYNVKLGSVDKMLGEMGVIPTSRTARLEQTAMMNLIKGKFEGEKDFMTKYGTTINMGLLIIGILIFIVGVIYIITELRTYAATNTETAKANKELIAEVTKSLQIARGESPIQSGLIPVMPPST